MKMPKTMEFRDVPMRHYFTAGWHVYGKLSDRTAVQTSGWLDGRGDIQNFAPDEEVHVWGAYPPSDADRHALANRALAHTLYITKACGEFADAILTAEKERWKQSPETK